MYMIASMPSVSPTKYMAAECLPAQGPLATCWGPLEVSSKMTFADQPEGLTSKGTSSSYPTSDHCTQKQRILSSHSGEVER